MPNFSTILQAPDIRALVQQNILERAFHDALFPRLLYRSEATPQLWPANVGDTMVFTGVGLITPKLQPLTPGQDPQPSSYTKEQWTAQLQQYADAIDTAMPTSIVAIANLFLRNAQQLGMSGGQSLNRLVRNRLFAAGLSGSTVATGANVASTSIHVQRLNGLTTARRPDLAAGSPVQFQTVSSSNPLAVVVSGNQNANVIGFTSDNPGDTVGPGTLTLDTAVTTAARDTVVSSDASVLFNVGGGASIDALGPTDNFHMTDIRNAVSRMRQENVPPQPDNRYHAHVDPTSESEVYGDTEWQRLLTAMPDHYIYRDFSVGELLGCAFLRNTESPLPETVAPFDGSTYSLNDPFPGELKNAGGTTVHRVLFVGQGSIYEYYQDLSQLITEAGITGRVGEPDVNNNSIEVMTDRIQLIIRSPLNRLQDLVSTAWKFIGDWPVRTDAATGDNARYKRMVVVQHA